MSEDIREKNKKASAKQKVKAAKQVKHEQTKEQIYSADPKELRKQLSNKNEEYIFKLNKMLVSDKFSESEATEAIDKLMPEIIENQIKGIPATQMYGPVTKKAGDIAHPKKPVKKTPFWALSVDTSLLFLALFGLLYGVISYTNQKSRQADQTGVVTLLILAALWGTLLTWFNIQMRKPKKERPGWLQTIMYIVIGLVVMMLFMGLSQFIPHAINPSLNGIGYFVLAVIAFGGRFVYRKLMGIKERSFF